MKWVISSAVATCLLAGVFWYGSSLSTPPSARASAPGARAAASRSAGPAKQREIERQSVEPAAAAPIVARPVHRHESVPPTAPTDAIAISIEDFSSLHALMDDYFEDDARDPTWAKQTSREIRQQLLERLPERSRVSSLECRTSLCRLVTVHEARADGQRFWEEGFAGAHAWPGGYTVGPIAQENAGFTLVTYLMREGHEAPALERTAME
jgi:hypothetical protein